MSKNENVETSKGFDLLICNGEMTGAGLASSLAKRAAVIVCADGGANSARELDIVPEVIIGDMDSISEENARGYSKSGVRFIHQSGQDITDFEKALLHLRDKQARAGKIHPRTEAELRCGADKRRLVILGVTGKLLDHTLGNFSILLRHAKEFKLTLFDEHYRIDVIDAATAFLSRPGDRISIIPLRSSNGVHYDGLKYDLPDMRLVPGENEGTCNEALSSVFHVHVTSGVLLVFRELHSALWDINVDESL